MIYFSYLLLVVGCVFRQGKLRNIIDSSLFWLAFFWYLFLIGTRFEIGVDWSNYEAIFNGTTVGGSGFGLASVFNIGFSALVILTKWFDFTYYEFNLSMACISLLLIFQAIRRSTERIIILVYIAPYLLTLVLMNYSRQALAVAILFYLIFAGFRMSWRRKTLYFFVGLAFHPSFALMYHWSYIKSRTYVLLAIGLCFVALASVVGAAYIDNYVTNAMQSTGALPRLLVYGLPIWMCFVLRTPVRDDRSRYIVLAGLNFSIVCAFCIAMNLTTVADRLGVYLIPFSAYALQVQLVQSRNGDILASLYVVASSVLLLVWMMYSEWATAWLPYKTWIQI